MATIGVKLELSSAEFRNGMKQATSEVKLFDAQLKGLSKGLSENTNAFAKHQAKTEALKGKLSALKTEQALLTQKLEEAKTKFGENSKEANNYATKLEYLNQNINETEKALKNQNGTWGAVGAAIAEVGEKCKAVGDKMQEVGKSMTTHLTVPIVAGFTASVKAFSDWESAFTGVMKTVDETATTTYADLQESIKKMATETASSKEEIAGVMEVAGQLAISADNLEEFTRTMIMLGDSTNLSSEEAATSIARILNITGEVPEHVDRIGAAIVALGNNFATDEASIVAMSNRLASAGTIAGLTTQEIFALSTAMSSVGIEAEAGGTAMTQTLVGISKAVDEGGAKLDQLAQVAGMDAETFANTWKSKPIDALQAFIDGLSKMNEEELNTYSILDELDMSGVRQSNMLQSLALANDTLAAAVNVANTAYDENTALVDEASKRYATFEAKMSQTKEKISNVGVEIGERLIPYVDKLLVFLDKVIAAWDTLSPDMQDTIVKIGLIVAAIGPLLMVIGKILSTVGQVMMFAPQIIAVISTIATFLTGTMIPAIISFATAAATAMLPFLPFIAIAAAVVAAGVLIYENWDVIKEKALELWTNLTEFFGGIRDAIVGKWEEIKENTSAVWEGIKGSVEEHGGGIKGVLGAYTEFYMNCWKGAFDAINQATGGKLGEAVTTIKNKLKEIKDKFTNLGKEALNWGKDLIDNFINGIKEKFEALKETLTSTAQLVKDILGFSEPKKGPLSNFHTYGPDMMKSYAQGIEDYSYLVKNAVEDVALDVSTLNGQTIDSEEIYSAVRQGSEDAQVTLIVGERELGRALRGMGVQMA